MQDCNYFKHCEPDKKITLNLNDILLNPNHKEITKHHYWIPQNHYSHRAITTTFLYIPQLQRQICINQLLQAKNLTTDIKNRVPYNSKRIDWLIAL